MVSKIRSRTNQTVDEIHQKKKRTSISVELVSFGNSPFNFCVTAQTTT